MPFPSLFASFCPLRCPRLSPLPPRVLAFFFGGDFISHAARCSDPSGRFLRHFNQALKITLFSFIHTGFAVMQPLGAGRREVNPLSRQQPHKLPSDSSMPKPPSYITLLPFPHPSVAENLHKSVFEMTPPWETKLIK